MPINCNPPRELSLAMLVISICVVLSGCPFRTNQDLLLDYQGPVLTVSNDRPQVGEIITVIIEGRIKAPRFAQEWQIEVGLGLCLKPEWQSDFDNYERGIDGRVTLPSADFTVSNDTDFVKVVTLDIKRNRIFEFSHEVQIAATRPGKVDIDGVYIAIDIPDRPKGIFGDYFPSLIHWLPTSDSP